MINTIPVGTYGMAYDEEFDGYFVVSVDECEHPCAECVPHPSDDWHRSDWRCSHCLEWFKSDVVDTLPLAWS